MERVPFTVETIPSMDGIITLVKSVMEVEEAIDTVVSPEIIDSIGFHNIQRLYEIYTNIESGNKIYAYTSTKNMVTSSNLFRFEEKDGLVYYTDEGDDNEQLKLLDLDTIEDFDNTNKIVYIQDQRNKSLYGEYKDVPTIH